jgi:hypothetical protein
MQQHIIQFTEPRQRGVLDDGFGEAHALFDVGVCGCP